jgi:hypothetical protein
MMVVFGMVLMAIFGLGSVAMMINPSQMSDPVANKVAVKWDGGQLKQSQVDNLRIRHFAAGRFINGVQRAAVQQKESYRSVALPIQWLGEGMDPREADFQIAQRFIMAERAKKEGIVVSDAMVNDYISLNHNLVDFSQPQLETINTDVNGGFVDLVDIRQQLKIELAAQQYRILLNTGLPDAPTPTEAAELYSKLEKTIECSVMPLNVADYVDKVTETPSNSELKKIFAEGQYKLSDPNQLDPGFKRAKRVKINYIAAEYADFETAEKLKIGDEQVQEEYKKLVAAEDPLVMELVPPTDGPDVDAPKPPVDGEAPVPPSDEDAAPAPPTEDESDDAPMIIEEQTEGNEKTTGEIIEESKGSAEEGSKTEGDGKAEGNGDELTLSASRPQFVSTLQDPETQESKAAKASAEKASEVIEKLKQEAAETVDVEKATQEAGEATTDPVIELEQEGSADAEMLEQGDDEIELPGSEDLVLPGDGDGEQDEDPVSPILTRPKELDDALADLIRERMIGDKALNAMKKVISDAEEAVREQQYDYADELEEAEKNNTLPEVTLDLKALANRLQAQYGETELLNFNQLSKDSGFGSRQAIVEIPSPFGGPPRRTSAMFSQVVYSQLENQILFEPGDPVVEFGTQTNILWWPVEIKEMEILTFAEAKDDVIAFWKLGKARELAREDAIRIAGELNGSGKKLMEYSEKAQNTGSFTWYINGLVQPQGVTSPGEEFMNAAFGLEMDECDGALNETGDFAYVIQKVFEDSRSDEDIQESLLSNWSRFQMVPPNVARTNQQETSALRTETQRSISKQMGVDWVAE